MYHNEDGLNNISKHFWQLEKGGKLSPTKFRENDFFVEIFCFFQLNYFHIVCKWLEIQKISFSYWWSKENEQPWKLKRLESKWNAFCWFHLSNKFFQDFTCCNLQTRHTWKRVCSHGWFLLCLDKTRFIKKLIFLYLLESFKWVKMQ